MTTITEINKIAKNVKQSVEKNQKLPTMTGYTQSQYIYLLAKSVANPGKSITVKKINKAPNPLGVNISRSIDKVDYVKLAKNIVSFIDNNGTVPNFVQFKTYKIAPKLFTYCFAKIVVFYAENKKLPSYCNFNSNVFKKTTIVSNDEVYNYFIKIFGKVSTIDEAFNKVKEHGYSYYFDDKYSNKQTIDRIYKKQGANCTDSCQVFWHIGKALGYEVRCIHVRCSSGDGHVRLQFKHSKHTSGNWINRDPAAIISANGKPLTYIWCEKGTKLAINPKWFLENVNR